MEMLNCFLYRLWIYLYLVVLYKMKPKTTNISSSIIESRRIQFPEVNPFTQYMELSFMR